MNRPGWCRPAEKPFARQPFERHGFVRHHSPSCLLCRSQRYLTWLSGGDLRCLWLHRQRFAAQGQNSVVLHADPCKPFKSTTYGSMLTRIYSVRIHSPSVCTRSSTSASSTLRRQPSGTLGPTTWSSYSTFGTKRLNCKPCRASGWPRPTNCRSTSGSSSPGRLVTLKQSWDRPRNRSGSS